MICLPVMAALVPWCLSEGWAIFRELLCRTAEWTQRSVLVMGQLDNSEKLSGGEQSLERIRGVGAMTRKGETQNEQSHEMPSQTSPAEGTLNFLLSTECISRPVISYNLLFRTAHFATTFGHIRSHQWQQQQGHISAQASEDLFIRSWRDKGSMILG